MTYLHQYRLGYIDVAKSLGMIAVIWGHICSGLSHTVVYAFHIPLFFFLSGLVFSRDRYGKFLYFVKRRIKGLLVPYLACSLITWIIWSLYSYLSHSTVDSYWMPFSQIFLAQGSEGYLVHNVPLWFVTCLFVVEILYYLLSGLSRISCVFMCLFCGLVGVWMTQTDVYDFSTLPWSTDVALLAIPFYAVGNIISTHYGHERFREFVRRNAFVAVIVSVVFSVACIICASYNGKVSMGHALIGHCPFLFYLNAAMGVASFIVICIFLDYWGIILEKGNFVEILKWFGRNSFGVMAVHNPIKGVIVVAIAKIFHVSTGQVGDNLMMVVMAFVGTVAITVVVLLLVSLTVCKIKNRVVILGKLS